MASQPDMDSPPAGAELARLQNAEYGRIMDRVHNLVTDARLSSLAQKYRENEQEREFDTGFNLFELISGHYYRETFHSDILHALLDPKAKHGAGNQYLRLFLKYIAAEHRVGLQEENYTEAQVAKEEGKMDILIKGSEHAILIENKINGARDTHRQLPRYLKQIEDRGYKCDAIIYLRLHGDAGPDDAEWTDEEKHQVKQKLKVICASAGASDTTEKDLLRGWIRKCETQSTVDSDARLILRQYGRIIERLGRQVMNNPVMDDFYKVIVDPENFKAAETLRTMLDELPNYRALRIVNQFKNQCAPFETVFDYKNGALFRVVVGQSQFQLAVWAQSDHYLFEFHDIPDTQGANRRAEQMLQKMGCLDEYILRNPQNPLEKVFRLKIPLSFPSEEALLFSHIKAFKVELQKHLPSKAHTELNNLP
ncbi:MAG: PD-(D/E)XK nuclease family protein [Verrucomicrobia bacterium]|nr:PD-(D/E)XK nuclease family protein [Verrucomicrobiota bacterium]